MQKKEDQLSNDKRISIPAMCLPIYRTSQAIQRKVEKNILIKTWGGIGDQICSEPTLRFALKSFKGCNITLASEMPELFKHLKFKKVYDLREHQPFWDNYFCFTTIWPIEDIVWQFLSHMITNCVDYPSLCAFRCQLPTAEKEVQLIPDSHDINAALEAIGPAFSKMRIAIHPGKHWQSKTFPKPWWDTVLKTIVKEGCIPVIIGGNSDDNRTTVDVDTEGCIDLRNKLKPMETVALLQATPVLLTNDSAPLHMAVSGDTWIGYVATCKHPDYITHWRNGQWGWRMKNHGLGGIWDILDYCPNVEGQVSAENVGDNLEKWLPNPEEFAMWGVAKCQR